MEKRDQGWLGSISDLAPFLFFLFLFYVIPIAFLVSNIRLSEFASLLADPYIIRLTENTAIQAIASTVPSIVLALPISYFLARYSFRGSGAVRNLLLTPFFAPAFAVTEGMIMLLGENGLVNQLGSTLLGAQWPVVNVLYSMEAVVIAHVFYYLPLAILILEQGFSMIDPDLLDAAHVAGAGSLLTFRAIYLNQLLPSVAAGSLLIFAFSFISYSTPILIGGKFSTLEVEIYATRTRTISASIALIQLSLTILFSIAILVWREKLYFRSQTVMRTSKTLRSFSSDLRGKFLFIYFVLLVFFELLPIYLVLAQAFSPAPVILVPSSVSLQNFIQLFDLDLGFGMRFKDALLQSISIATVASSLSVFISIFIVWQSGQKESIRKLTSMLISLPLSVSRSSLALGIMLSYGFGLLQLYGSWVLILIGHIAVIVPLIIRLIEASWIRIGPEIREAAEASGADRLFRLLRLEVPLMAPAILASFLLAFSSSISEFTFSTFFSTFNLMPLPVSVAVLVDLRRMDLASALTSLIILIIIAAEVMSSFASEESLQVI